MTQKPDRFLRLPGVQSLVPLARSAMYSEIARGTFPAPVKITSASGKSAAVAWSENAVLAWIERKLAEGRAGTSTNTCVPSPDLDAPVTPADYCGS